MAHSPTPAGRVVGINTAVAGVGLGLAVPINDATRRIVGALMSEGRFRRAYLGLGGGERPLPPRLARRLDRRDCVEVVQVVDGGPAARRRRAAGRPAGGGRRRARRGWMTELQRLLVGERIGGSPDDADRRARRARLLELAVVPRELS